VWPGQCIRLDPWDFESRDWVPDSGWPITADALEPFYRRAESWLGIPERASDEQAWRRFGLVPPAFDPARLTHKSAVYSPHPDVGAFYRTAFEEAANVRVLLHATAARIDGRHGGRVAEELELRSLGGRVGRVRAGTFVLCGGGIENARLLLLSGLGDEHDVVGRYLQDHPTVWADVRSDRPEALQAFYGRLGRGKVRYVPRVRLSWEAQRRHQVLNAVATPIYDYRETPGMAAARELSSALQERRRPARLGRGEVYGALRQLDRVAVAGYRRFARGRPSPKPVRGTRLQILCEQGPNRDSRVVLSPDHDVLGLPKAKVDWRLSELERRTARVVTDILDDELSRLGLGKVAALEWLDGDGWAGGFEDAYHPSGTTRMSADPAKGVVDSNCRVHGVPGLYLSGSSVFPTGGYANPTLTILALALRLADHLKTSARRGQPWT
jgi:choline dehydrogenase-like flavoprotein